jgi:hypothetical protein
MMTRYVDVKSVDEYFSLPVEVREWYGFYKKPYALAWDFMDDTGGWIAFYREIRKHYPLQWFFREWLFSCANPVYRTFSYICYKFRGIK